MKPRKAKKKPDLKKRRTTPPEVYVRRTDGPYGVGVFAHAKIIVVKGEYQYLQWRDGVKVRRLYLGRKRK